MKLKEFKSLVRWYAAAGVVSTLAFCAIPDTARADYSVPYAAKECAALRPAAADAMDFRINSLPYEAAVAILIENDTISPQQRWILQQWVNTVYIYTPGQIASLDPAQAIRTFVGACISNYGNGSIDPVPSIGFSKRDGERRGG